MRHHRWTFKMLGPGLWDAECADCGADAVTTDDDPAEADSSRAQEYGPEGLVDCDERQVGEVMDL